MRRFFAFFVLLSTAGGFSACALAPDGSAPPRPFVSAPSDGFTNFETEPVRPLALSEDGRFLYALNTADDRLEIFDTQGDGLRSIGETGVGLRPVALVVHGQQVWVVNHLSDSVSVVDVGDPARPRVTHTLQVGDEPRGIVVGGPKRDRVFVATARRDETLTPGVGRAQLWVFQAARPKAAPQIATLFGAKPRALAASADGRHVYAAVFLSGNRTASVSGEDAVRLGRARQVYFDQVPYAALPKQGPIVKRTERGWRDYDDREWSAAVAFDLPDYDVFVVDAAAEQPKVIQTISDVGTVLFNLAVQPGSGEIWVSNTEAFNHIPHESRLNGRFAQNRITRVIPDKTNGYRTVAIDLNPQIAAGGGARRSRARVGATVGFGFSTRRSGSLCRGVRIAQGRRGRWRRQAHRSYQCRFRTRRFGARPETTAVVRAQSSRCDDLDRRRWQAPEHRCSRFTPRSDAGNHQARTAVFLRRRSDFALWRFVLRHLSCVRRCRRIGLGLGQSRRAVDGYSRRPAQ